VGRELGVDYLLTGTVRWEKSSGGNRVRVSPELIDVTSGASRWQQPFDAKLTDVFQVQADIAGRVADALDLAMGARQKQTLEARPTENLAAYDAFLKGEAISQGIGGGDPPALQRAIGFYEQAVALDSVFVQAWAQLARAHAYLYFTGIASPTTADKARSAAQRAAALGPGRPEGQLALGDYQQFVQADAGAARAAYQVGLKAAPGDAELLSAIARAEQSLGQWDAALAHFQRAQASDPRSLSTLRRLGLTLLWLRRYPEAHAAMDRGLAILPSSVQLIEQKVQVFLAQGNLPGARAALKESGAAVEPTALVAQFGNYWDLYWVLDNEQQELLLRLPPSAFGDNAAAWAIVRAQTLYLRGDTARARVYADSAQIAFEEQLQTSPNDGQLHVLRGLALAYVGRKADAVREGERSAGLPLTRDMYTGAYIQHQIARIYLLVGEPDKALDQLEQLLRIPYYLSPGWLKVDPSFDRIRNHPRFQRLLAGS
jgi:tetratricopeptide (TPR) repeat protein